MIITKKMMDSVGKNKKCGLEAKQVIFEEFGNGLGSKKMPCKCNPELTMAMKGRKNCVIYCTKELMFHLYKINEQDAKARNIKLRFRI